MVGKPLEQFWHYLQYRDIGSGGDGGGARYDPAADIGHLAEAIVTADDVEQPSVLGHAYATVDHDVEGIAHLVLAHEDGLRRLFLPFADAQDLPQFDIGEVLEQRQLAQGGELLGLVVLDVVLLEAPERS